MITPDDSSINEQLVPELKNQVNRYRVFQFSEQELPAHALVRFHTRLVIYHWHEQFNTTNDKIYGFRLLDEARGKQIPVIVIAEMMDMIQMLDIEKYGAKHVLGAYPVPVSTIIELCKNMNHTKNQV